MADEQFPLRQFLGGKIASQTQALAGIKRAEDEQNSRFEAAKQNQEQLSAAMAPIQEALQGTLGDAGAAAVKRLQVVEGRFAKEAPAVDVPEGIFSGSVGVTRVPPYDYRWTWNAQDGGATANVAANNANGQESFYLYNNGRDAHAWGAVGLGIYFRPMYNGYIHLWANPSFNYSWGTYSVFQSSHSDGWLGLYVGQYNLSGDLDRVAVSQQISQWNDNSWWSGAGSHNGSNSGYPLSAWFYGYSSRWYAMWVWAGGSVYGAGWSTFSGSGAISGMSLGVPSISLVLY